MWDVRIADVAGHQFNRVSRHQLLDLGISKSAIHRLVASGRLVTAEQGVFAVAPLLEHDDWGKWMGATLTAPATLLSNESALAAYGMWTPKRWFETVTRPGSGGPTRYGGILVYRSTRLDGDCSELRGIPITSVPRTLLDLSARASNRWVARLVRDSVKDDLTTLTELGDALGRYRGRRGAGRLAKAIARYAGLPLERARSGAEVRAMEILRDNQVELPQLNVRIAGEEADLSWAERRLIIEIDGGPFHLDVGEDARKEKVWRGAGWTVRRLPSDDVYARPHRLLSIAPPHPAERHSGCR